MDKTLRRVLWVTAALIVIFLLALPKLNLFSTEEADAAPTAGGGAPAATVVEGVVTQPTRLDNRVVTTGTVLPNEEVELRSEISGKVTAISFREGDRVRRGQTLVRINDEDLRAQLQRLNYQQQLAEENERRYKLLRDREAISLEEYDVIATELKTAGAEIDNLRAQLDKAVLRAPFDGTIGLRQISLGSYISPTTTIANLVDADPVKVEFALPARYAASVRKGRTVRYRVEGAADAFEGEIYAVEPKIDPVTRTLQVRAVTPNPDGKLRPGSFATVELVLEEIEETILLPTEAVVPDLNGHKVYVSRAGKATPQVVEIGLRTADQIQITAGVVPGDTVVTRGVLNVRDGAALRFREVGQTKSAVPPDSLRAGA
ncbi:MAG: efflux RND transporter periplasmic adaptor subunit [Catalinimonas sp.]